MEDTNMRKPDLVEVVEDGLKLDKYVEHVADPGAGAVSTFSGVTRNHFQGREVRKLEYEAYVPMAIKVMQDICLEARKRTVRVHAFLSASVFVLDSVVPWVRGSPSLRFLLQKYAARCQGVLFVIDSVDFLPNVTLAAEHLLDILLLPDIAGPKIPILVACNKAERVTAHGVDFLRKRLEKEVEQLKSTRLSLVEDGMAKQLISGVGRTDKYFSFADCRNKVEFAKVSVYKGDIALVQKFIRAANKR
eukprot:jgi/Pico_ML_1/55089/g839.t1